MQHSRSRFDFERCPLKGDRLLHSRVRIFPQRAEHGARLFQFNAIFFSEKGAFKKAGMEMPATSAGLTEGAPVCLP